MADPFTPGSLSGYNASPPADDGTQVAANQITWAKIKDKLTDPLKTLLEATVTAVDAAFDTVSSLFFSTTTKTADYTVLTTDAGELFLVDTNTPAANVTMTLPAASSAGNGFRVSFKKTTDDNFKVIIDGNASETIDGALTLNLYERYDSVSLVCDGSNWHVGVDSRRGGWHLLEAQTASASATLDFEYGFADSVYTRFKLEISELLPATDAKELYVRVSDDAGATYEADAADYSYAFHFESEAGGGSNVVSAGDTKIRLTGNTQGNLATETMMGTVYFDSPESTTAPAKFWFFLTYINASAQLCTCNGSAAHDGATDDINGIRFFYDAGNIASGTIKLYGLKE